MPVWPARRDITSCDVHHRGSLVRRRDPGRGHRRPAGPAGAARPCRPRLCARAKSGFVSWLDRAPVMIWTARPDTTLDYINRTCAGVHRAADREDAADEGWLDAVHPDDRDHCCRHLRSGVRGAHAFPHGVPRAPSRRRLPMAAGLGRPEVWSRTARFAGYIGCDVDITERREAEERTRESRAALEVSHREIQQLAGRLIEAQDAERARVARDLHDDVSQQLAGLSIALSGLKRRMDESHVSEDAAGGPAGPAPAHDRAGAERPSPLTRPASHRAAARRAGGRPDLLLRRARALARHRLDAAARKETSRPSPRRSRSACTGSRRKRCATSSRTPAPAGRTFDCSAPATTRRSRSRTTARGSMSPARSSGARVWGWSASPSGSGSREAPSASPRS